jgi:hypothetical protein
MRPERQEMSGLGLFRGAGVDMGEDVGVGVETARKRGPAARGLLAVAPLLVAVLGLMVAVGGAGCAKNSAGGGGEPDAEVGCESKEDCPPGYDCVGDTCVPEQDGSTLEPDIEVAPVTVDLGSPAVGEPSAATVTVTNVGEGDLVIDSISLEEDDTFEELTATPTGNLGETVGPGESLTIDVELVNLDAEADTGRLTIASNDPDEPTVIVEITSQLEGDEQLGTCVMEGGSLFDQCATNPEIIDYGEVAYDATAIAEVSVFNQGSGNAPLVIRDIFATDQTGDGALYQVEILELVEDTQDPSGYRAVDLTDFPAQPVYLGVDDGQGVPEALLVMVTLHATLDGQPVPPEELIVETGDASPYDQHAIPFTGEILCPPEYYDIDGDPGCEYNCVVSNNGQEACDGLDNDCNGQTDDGVNPGLCMVCNANGIPVEAADDEDCGDIDCSGWYTKTGTQGPTDTDECYAHEDILTNRCEAADDCKDPNSTDCDPQPLLGTPLVSCGTCQYVDGCTGTTPGTCADYTAGTRAGLCQECGMNGTVVDSNDDTDCGNIECGGWYTKQGVAGATTTEECYGHEDLLTDRCEGAGDCKDENSADCDTQSLEAAPSVTCGICQQMQGCSQTTPGSCTNYPAGTSTGLCAECDGSGSRRAPADDSGCGTVACSSWFIKQGVEGPLETEECYGHQDITTGRCEGLGDCLDSNTADCNGQPLLGSPSATCGICQYMAGCSGTTSGQCVSYPDGTLTSGTCGTGVCERPYHCDGSGNNVCTPGAITGDDSACNGLDDNCNGATDENYTPYTCGLGICQSTSTCSGGTESCTPGTPQATDDPDDSFTDTNCDGIDGNESTAVFVATDGNDGWSGTKSSPKQTIQAGIDTAASQGKDVYVSAGTYTESLTLESGVSIYGGYSRANGWARSDSYDVIVQGGTTAVTCSGQSTIVIDRLTIRSANNTSTGGSSYAVRLSGCQDVLIRRSNLEADDGGNGGHGWDGSHGPSGSSGLDGQEGCEDSSGFCGSCSRPSPGSGGWGCGGNYGGRGGYPGKGGNNGSAGLSGTGPGGAGGAGGDCDRDSNGTCSWGCWNGDYGSSGSTGAAGTNGAGGVSFNTSSTSSYFPDHGSSGTTGSPGGGGGGGGGGHGGDDYCDSYGSSGGGGGGGGCGGTGGSRGTGGGGSFAVWAYDSTNIQVQDCAIVTGDGGAGGSGGSGGLGGSGGAPGSGRLYGGGDEQDDAGCGGNGGYGGTGGQGGHGGGGGGGPTIGIVFRSCSSSGHTGNTFTLGAAGTGGYSPGSSGSTGQRTNVRVF